MSREDIYGGDYQQFRAWARAKGICPECCQQDKVIHAPCPYCSGERLICTRCSRIVKEHVTKVTKNEGGGD